MEVNGYYYNYYVQSMWDAELEFIIKTKYESSSSIKQTNGEFLVENQSVRYRNVNTTYKSPKPLCWTALHRALRFFYAKTFYKITNLKTAA